MRESPGSRLRPLHSVDPAWVPLLVAGGLATASLLHFGDEVSTLQGALGPGLAFLITLVPVFALFGVALRIYRIDLSEAGKWTVDFWLVVGLLTGLALFGLTIAIRLAEGRSLAEPEFPLLAAGGFGAVTGAGVGYLLARLRERAEDARRARDVLAFTNRLLRHDLRNGIQTIDGRVELLREDPADVDAIADAVGSQTGSILALVDDVAAVSALFQGIEEPAPMDVVPTVAEVVDNAREGAPNATLTLDAPEEAIAMATDALRPVVRNVVTNATEHADREPTIDVGVRRSEDSVSIVVADDGPGIPPAEREAVFESNDGTADGGGGLYIAATIVRELGGEVSVSEGNMGGARFEVSLPAG